MTARLDLRVKARVAGHPQRHLRREAALLLPGDEAAEVVEVIAYGAAKVYSLPREVRSSRAHPFSFPNLEELVLGSIDTDRNDQILV